MSMLRGFLDWVVHGDDRRHRRLGSTARERLLVRRKDLLRQIEILGSPPVHYRDRTPERPRLAGELRLALEGLEQEIAKLGHEDE